MYDGNNGKLGFFYNEVELKVNYDDELTIDQSYKITIQQERMNNVDYILSIQKDGTKIYSNFNPTPFVLPTASIFFSNDYKTSLGNAALIENVSIIKGNFTVISFCCTARDKYSGKVTK